MNTAPIRGVDLTTPEHHPSLIRSTITTPSPSLLILFSQNPYQKNTTPHTSSIHHLFSPLATTASISHDETLTRRRNKIASRDTEETRRD
ncbi:hypothetical protein PIB30_030213 [Stylosanthes scabra]|uniref:Uncharacterized protein n=1 Tax=Stylosanthes scabra TaxID=79078 RepID=A0ABU6UDA5_9FABA|nr:hypothetical protein [Stylosanthes scabra]